MAQHHAKAPLPNARFRECPEKLYGSLVARCDADKILPKILKSNPKEVDSNGDTYLHVAARHSVHNRVVQELILHVDLTARNEFGQTALDVAATRGFDGQVNVATMLDVVRRLIGSGDHQRLGEMLRRGWSVWPLAEAQAIIDIDEEEDEGVLYIQPFADQNKIARLIREDVIDSVLADDVEAVVSQIEQTPGLAERRDGAGMTILHVAALHNRAATALEITRRYPRSLSVMDNAGRTPLHIAAAVDSRLLQAMRDAGGDINTTDRIGNAPGGRLDIGQLRNISSILSGRMQVFQELIDKLEHVIAADDVPGLRRQLEQRVIVSLLDRSGLNLLHKAVIGDSRLVVEFFLNKFPESLEIRDAAGRTPLHLAEMTAPELVEMLERAGADPDVTDVLGRRPRDYRGNQKLRLQVKDTADLLKQLFETTCQSALVHQSVCLGHLCLLRRNLYIRSLSTLPDHTGLPPLHKSLILGHEQITNYLINKYPETVQPRDHMNRSVLHIAGALQDKSKYQLFLKMGLDQKEKDKSSFAAEDYLRGYAKMDLENLRQRIHGQYPRYEPSPSSPLSPARLAARQRNESGKDALNSPVSPFARTDDVIMHSYPKSYTSIEQKAALSPEDLGRNSRYLFLQLGPLLAACLRHVAEVRPSDPVTTLAVMLRHATDIQRRLADEERRCADGHASLLELEAQKKREIEIELMALETEQKYLRQSYETRELRRRMDNDVWT